MISVQSLKRKLSEWCRASWTWGKEGGG